MVTSFEAYGKWKINPTEVAIKELDGQTIHLKEKQVSIIGKVIPARFRDIKDVINRLIAEIRPDGVILTGQSGGSKIRIERTAKNFVKTKIPYNCGTTKSGEQLEIDGPNLYESNLPVNAILSKLEEKNVPVELSDDAGSFGCNQIFYQVRNKNPNLAAGLIHVPLLPSQTEGQKFMDQETITLAIKLSLIVLSEYLEQNKPLL